MEDKLVAAVIKKITNIVKKIEKKEENIINMIYQENMVLEYVIMIIPYFYLTKKTMN